MGPAFGCCDQYVRLILQDINVAEFNTRWAL